MLHLFKMNHKVPEINFNILYLILKKISNEYDVLELQDNNIYRIGHRKFIRHSFDPDGITLIFKYKNVEYHLKVYKQFVSVYKGKTEIVCTWTDGNDEFVLNQDFERVLNKIWHSEFNTKF